MIYFIVMHLLKNDILIEYFTAVFNVDEREIAKHFHFFFKINFVLAIQDGFTVNLHT